MESLLSPPAAVPIPHRPSRVWLLPILAFAAALAAAVVSSEQLMVSMWDHGHDRWRIFTWQLSTWSFWAFASPLLIAAGGRLFRSRPWWRRLPSTLGLGLLLISLQLLSVAAIATLLQPFEPVAHYSYGRYLVIHLAKLGGSNLVICGGLLTLGHLLAGYRQTRHLELQESRLETELARAQLAALRLQIEPHFLFNSLNSIAALIRRDDRDAALRAVLELGELLRSTLEGQGEQLVPLADEWVFVERYIHLQRLRFADRLQVTSRLHDGAETALVPPLLLQPLVENALEHGLRRRREPLQLELSAQSIADRLRIVVRDDGPGLPPEFDLERDQGVGLGNLRSRLHHLFGEAAELRIEALEPGVQVTIELPDQRPPETTRGRASDIAQR
ncbi:MAG: histidine kinase [Acidobacteriota bacterium]